MARLWVQMLGILKDNSCSDATGVIKTFISIVIIAIESGENILYFILGGALYPALGENSLVLIFQ